MNWEWKKNTTEQSSSLGMGKRYLSCVESFSAKKNLQKEHAKCNGTTRGSSHTAF
jgi:hypothetical protein